MRGLVEQVVPRCDSGGPVELGSVLGGRLAEALTKFLIF
jgi:hypothetical protein